MSITTDVALVLNGAVGLTTGALALLVLAAGPRRNWNQWLAFFLVLVSGNFLAEASHAAGVPAGLARSVAFAFLALDPAVLAYFASIFPRRGGLAQRPAALALLGLLVVGFLAYEVATRRMSDPGQPDMVRILFFLYLGACYAYAAHRLLGSYLGERSTVMSRQLQYVVTGTLVMALPRLALLFSDVGPSLFCFQDCGISLPFNVLDLAFRLAVLGGAFALVMHRVRRAPGAPAEARSVLRFTGAAFALFGTIWTLSRGEYILGLAAGLPFFLGTLGRELATSLTYTGRWFVFCAAVVYGLVRYQALAVRVKALGAGALGLAVVGGALVVGLGAPVLGAWAAAAISGGVALLAVALALRLGRAGDADFLHHRSLEVYRALVAAFLANPQRTPDAEAELEHERARLGVSLDEHHTLVAIARAEELGTQAAPPIGRYAIVRRLDTGGSATVYLARDEGTRELVVLKRLHAAGASRAAALRAAEREVEVARGVSHPNVVAVRESVPVDDGVVLVMEYAEGGSLRGLLERKGKLPPAEAASLLGEVLAGLAALHEAGIVHGDLKPENVLLGADGHAKVADFGIARGPQGPATRQRDSLAGAGTLAYMAPEQAEGRPATVASDVYAAGSLGYEMITGRPVAGAAGGGPLGVLRAVVEGPPADWSAVPEAWRPSLQRALSTEPDRRFSSASAMQAALPGASGGAAKAWFPALGRRTAVKR